MDPVSYTHLDVYKRQVLDHYIYGIWVDEATKTIIATDVNNDEPILKFNFG